MVSADFERKLEKYAEVIVRVGLNLRAGQRLIINRAPLEAAPLVRLVAKQAYLGGARLVDVIWNDELLTLLRYQLAPRDSFGEFPSWRSDALYSFIGQGDALLGLFGGNPDLLAGQDPELIATAMRLAAQQSAKSDDIIMNAGINWLGAAVPTSSWATKVFPGLPPEQGVNRLWEAIFDLCRLNSPDPVAAWQVHLNGLAARCAYLNQKRYAALHFTGPGTDLTVGLADNHLWEGGGTTSQNGIYFTPNLPTEEVFTLPHREKVDGHVAATKPLTLGGTLIENFSLTFEKGRVIKLSAEKGEATLRSEIEMDEGAARLGEVALVPNSSPVSRSGLLFYNTLFDENASNHIALGDGYAVCMEGGPALSKEAFMAAGGNRSLIHTDFMIGSGQMDVDGLAESGTAEPVMRAGEWVFNV